MSTSLSTFDRKFTRRTYVQLAGALVLILAIVAGLAACTSSGGGNHKNGQSKAFSTANNRKNYIPVNDVEGQNYNARQRLADQPSTLLWCTAYPTNPNAKVFTVPIVGKLTSGNKRPFPTTQAEYDSSGSGTYNTDLPGADGFFGTSSDYRYGFDPNGGYHDFTGLELYCTTVPDVIQSQTTKLDISVNTGTNLTQLDHQVEAALKTCQQVTRDPSKPCQTAAALLGLNK